MIKLGCEHLFDLKGMYCKEFSEKITVGDYKNL
jgi:hypothetical protein